MTSYQPNSKGVVILGMHRSGTSCLAGMLELAGFWSGEVEEWNPDNLKGNRENTQVVSLNDSLLRQAGGSWDKPPSRPLSPEPWQLDERSEIVASLCSHSGPWMFKDPRTLLTLPFWMEALPGAQLIGIIRYPVSVANSLLVRNNLSVPNGLRLWQSYNQRLLEALAEREFPILLFSDDLALFTGYVEKYMRSHFPEAVGGGLIDPVRAGEFASLQLVHQSEHPLSDLRVELTHLGIAADRAESIHSVWAELLRRVMNPPDRKDQRQGDTKRPPPPAPAHQLSGIQHETDIERKLASLEQLIQQEPLRSDLWHYGLKVVKHSGDPGRIQQWLERGLAVLGADPLLLSKKAELEWLDGNQDLAISMMTEVVENTNGWVPALKALSKWHFARQEWKQAAHALHEIVDRSREDAEDTHFIQLFVDSGAGFSEEASIRIPAGTAKIRQRFEFSLLKFPSIRKLRLDPLNDYSIVKVHDIRLLDEGHQDLAFELSGTNATSTNGDVYYFALKDPQIGIQPAAGSKAAAQQLSVSLEFLSTGASALEEYLAQLDPTEDRRTRKVKRSSGTPTYDFSVLETIGPVKKPISDELDFVLAWNVEARTSEGASPGCQILHGWICPTAEQAFNLALKYNGATRSYPMNVDRPDVWKAVAKKPENLHHVTCGFSYEVPESATIEVGVDHEMKLYWLESLLT